MPVGGAQLLPYKWLSCNAVVQAAQQLAADKRPQCAGKTKLPPSNRLKQDRTPVWRRYDFLP